MPYLFDPLGFPRTENQSVPGFGPDGLILRFHGPALAHQRKKAHVVAMAYEKLIRLQLEHDGASVRKIMVLGRVRLEGDRYVAA